MAPGQPGVGHSPGNGRSRWRVEQCYTGLGPVSPRGTVATVYWLHERERAEADARRLNGQAPARGSE